MKRALLLLWLVAGCKQELEAKVGAATLPQANGVVPAADARTAPTVVVLPGKPVPAFRAGPVRLAVDLGVPWRELAAALAAADAAGARPSLLVGHRTTVHGFVIDDELEADRYSLRLQTTGTGKFCLSPPGTREAYCVESADRRHVSSMYVREAIQKAVAEYNIMQARVVPDADARWGDIVRTIDGARTCCGARQFRVAIARP